MKRIIIISVIALLSFTVMAQEEKKVAVFDPAGSADDNIKEIVREVISSVVVNTGGYTVLERQLIDKVLAENRFQAGGMVDDSQIVEMGKLMGANFAFVSTVVALGTNFFISGKMIDVQTARIVMQETVETERGTSDLTAVVRTMVGEMFTSNRVSDNNDGQKAKANPVYTIPTGLTATHGQRLSAVALPSGWSWMNGSALVGNEGMQTHRAKFTPSDVNRYNIVENIDVAVRVTRASTASGQTVVPAATVNPSDKNKKHVPWVMGIEMGMTVVPDANPDKIRNQYDLLGFRYVTKFKKIPCLGLDYKLNLLGIGSHYDYDDNGDDYYYDYELVYTQIFVGPRINTPQFGRKRNLSIFSSVKVGTGYYYYDNYGTEFSFGGIYYDNRDSGTYFSLCGEWDIGFQIGCLYLAATMKTDSEINGAFFGGKIGVDFGYIVWKSKNK